MLFLYGIELLLQKNCAINNQSHIKRDNCLTRLVCSHGSKHKHLYLAQSVPDSLFVCALLTVIYIKAGARVGRP